MDKDIANKYYSKIERKIILILHKNPKDALATRSIYNRMKGEYIYQYVSLTLTNLSCLGVIKKISDPKNKRQVTYMLSAEYKKLVERLAEEEDMEKGFLLESEKESDHERSDIK